TFTDGHRAFLPVPTADLADPPIRARLLSSVDLFNPSGAAILERRAEAGDLRKFRLIQTPAGKRALTQGRAALGGVFDERLRRLTPDEVSSFGRTVSRLARPRNGGA
ncbi:MAG: hypothetical protein WKF75_14360, partial [Singulisphaera sp.]